MLENYTNQKHLLGKSLKYNSIKNSIIEWSNCVCIITPFITHLLIETLIFIDKFYFGHYLYDFHFLLRNSIPFRPVLCKMLHFYKINLIPFPTKLSHSSSATDPIIIIVILSKHQYFRISNLFFMNFYKFSVFWNISLCILSL